MESKDRTSIKPVEREPVKTVVKYLTKKTCICPTQPILTVERLPHLEYHVDALTESMGRRPRLYQQGKVVRFVPESNEEYRTIQRYLAQIEAEEGIPWSSHSLPPGSGLEVNLKVRVVEVVKITEDLEKLKLQDGANLSPKKPKSTRHKSDRHKPRSERK